MAKGTKTLKSALKSQQLRLQHTQRLKQAAQVSEAKAKRKSQPEQKPRLPTIPFHPTDTILLVGEGDFSFTHALVCHPPSGLEHLPSRNITATTYDSEDECYTKYPGAKAIVEELRTNGVSIYFSVDATRLEKTPTLKGLKWDRIVWNFPHAGKGISDQDRNILANQMLILGFLRSAGLILKDGSIPSVMPKKRKSTPGNDSDAQESAEDTSQKFRGTVLITLRNVAPYTVWNVPALAKNPPPPNQSSTPPNPRYIQLRSFTFHRPMWKGYAHRMTKGDRAHGTGKTGEGGEDRTWEFCLK